MRGATTRKELGMQNRKTRRDLLKELVEEEKQARSENMRFKNLLKRFKEDPPEGIALHRRWRGKLLVEVDGFKLLPTARKYLRENLGSWKDTVEGISHNYGVLGSCSPGPSPCGGFSPAPYRSVRSQIQKKILA